MSGRLSDDELAGMRRIVAANDGLSPGTAEALLAHADALEAELAAANRRAGTAEAVLADLYSERVAENTARREERALIVGLLVAQARKWDNAVKIETDEYRGMFAATRADELSRAAAMLNTSNEPPPPGAILARLNEALESLRMFTSLTGGWPGTIQAGERWLRTLEATRERAAEILRRAEGKEVP